MKARSTKARTAKTGATTAGSGAPAPGPTPLDLPLDGGGTTFIEASAGTGKTHALTTLVARLVLEKGRPIDRILVVTFTRAATAELRDRIRRVLGMLRAAVGTRLLGNGGAASEPDIDPHAKELLAAWERREGEMDLASTARRLEAAMHDIDRANVFTIHGFCQRVLADLAFESGFPFGCEVGGDDEMVAAAVRDFWRRRLYPASTLLVRHAVDNGFLPGGLAGWVSGRRVKIGARLVGCDVPAAPLEVSEAAWREVFDAAREEWKRSRSQIFAEILEGPWLNRQRYRTASTKRDLTAFDALFAGSEARLPDADTVKRYGRKQLSLKGCKKNFEVPDNKMFDAFDRLEEASRELRSTYDQWLRWARAEALTDVRESVRKRIRADRRLAYDDLLLELDDALGGTGGEHLAERIRREFPCALIDEYQDTDPVQARIFSRIYGGVRAEPAEAGETGETGPDGDTGTAELETFRKGAVENVGDAGSEGDVGTAAPETFCRGAIESVGDAGPDGDADAAELETFRRGAIENAGDPGSEGGVGAAEPETFRNGAIKNVGDADLDGDAGTAEPETFREGAIENAGDADPDGETGAAGPFIVVGDPKQSIYRFRGADVFAYLAARRTATEHLHLDRNWRSVPALVDAVNAVFAGADPFVTPEIEYRPVTAAGEHGKPGDSLRLASGEDGAPLEFWLLPRLQEEQPLKKQEVNPVVAGATANEIARLLELAARGEAAIGDRALTGADIAVLVRTREQGRLIAGALREQGVRSIEIDDGSVFHTREAEQLERLLWSVADPGRERRVRGALAGDLFGLDAPALLALGDDERAWGVWAGRLADWRSHWQSRGIGSVLLRLLESEGGAKRLLGHRDGARRLTNYRHLAELLQEAETRERLAPTELAGWLNRRRTDSGGHDDDIKLRIESDEQLVKVLTMHGAKGLEFPVVFCPFAWDVRGPRKGSDVVDTVYHLRAADDFDEVINLAPDGEAKAIEWQEEFSESVRLLYVALTRAKHRCVVAWGQVRGAEHAPLAWLLHRSSGAPAPDIDPGSAGQASAVAEGEGAGAGDPGVAKEEEGVDAGDSAAAAEEGVRVDDPAIAALGAAAVRFGGLGAQEWLDEIDAFAQCLPDAVSVSVLDPEPPPIRPPMPSEDAPPVLSAREFRRPLRRIRSLTSFSALSAEALPAGGPPGAAPVVPDEAEVDRPDHDQHQAPVDVDGDEAGAAGAAAAERTAFTFPRGPVAGSCLHRIFERLDVSHENAADRSGLDEICGDALVDFGFDLAWRPVARAMVERTRSVLLHELEPESSAGNGSGGHADSGGRTGSGGGVFGQGGVSGQGKEAGEDDGTNRVAADGSGGMGGLGGSNGSGAMAGFRLDGPHRRLVELGFHFPVEGFDRERLAGRMVEHGYPDPFARTGGAEASRSPPPIHGFLRGYIDLVIEHAGRWYILDYKSNWLGPGPDDYAPEALASGMRTGGYSLQSLIYLVALHRYLAVRLPEYDCERHLGGAFYLFVRGIDPAAGMRRGVYFDRPSAACLLALDDCFRGGGA